MFVSFVAMDGWMDQNEEEKTTNKRMKAHGRTHVAQQREWLFCFYYYKYPIGKKDSEEVTQMV